MATHSSILAWKIPGTEEHTYTQLTLEFQPAFMRRHTIQQ